MEYTDQISRIQTVSDRPLFDLAAISQHSAHEPVGVASRSIFC
jgi:hypothetical protein